MNAVYAFNVTDATPSDWFIDLKNGNGSLGSGQYDGKVDCTMTCSTSAFIVLDLLVCRQLVYSLNMFSRLVSLHLEAVMQSNAEWR